MTLLVTIIFESVWKASVERQNSRNTLNSTYILMGVRWKTKGLGFVIYHHQDRSSSGCGTLPSKSTVFQAEIEDIRQGGKHLRTTDQSEEM